MTKKQKIWLVIFGAMFLIPEILWTGTVGKAVYYWVLGNSVKGGILSFNLLVIPQSANLAKFIYLVEFIGILGSFIYIINFYHPKNKLLKYFLLILLGLLLSIAFCYVMFVMSFGNLP